MPDDPQLTTAQNNSLGVLNSWLGNFNLGSLYDTVKSWIVNGYSDDRIKLELQNSDQFKQEFPEYQAAIKAGTPMTPAEIMSYRETVTSMFKDAGLPSGFYDNRDDFVDLISKRLSPKELSDRVDQGYTRVASAPQEVKDAFGQYFGIKGNDYLATFFLDPERGGKFLEDAATQAEIGGAGSQYGFNVSQTQAQRYQEQGISGQQARQAFQQAYQLNPLAEESISEQEDLSKETLGEAALTGGQAEAQVQRRQQERSAAFRGGGGAATQRQGLGLGGAS